jgi:hypothetical protein
MQAGTASLFMIPFKCQLKSEEFWRFKNCAFVFEWKRQYSNAIFNPDFSVKNLAGVWCSLNEIIRMAFHIPSAQTCDAFKEAAPGW